MGEHDVPKTVNLKDFVLTLGSSSQRTASWNLNSASWASPLPVPFYVARECHLSKQELAKDGLCQYWVVTPKVEPDVIVSACESTQKYIFISDKTRGDDDGYSGGFRKATGYAIASVYTNPAYRRLGMASFMLKELQAWFDDAAQSNAECSALYSDIGRDYYGKLGWSSFSAWQGTLVAARGVEGIKGMTPTYGGRGGTRYLTEAEIPALCEVDMANLEEKFRHGFDDDNTHVAFTPSWPQVAWHLARCDFMAKELFRRDIDRRGAMTASGKSWAYFDHDFRENKIKIIRMVSLLPSGSSAERDDEMAALLEAAMLEAAEWNFPKVLLWDPDHQFETALNKVAGAREEMDVIFDSREQGSVPSFRWKEDASTETTVWEENHYFGWC